MDENKPYTFDKWFAETFPIGKKNSRYPSIYEISKHAWSAAIESAARRVIEEESVDYGIRELKAE